MQRASYQRCREPLNHATEHSATYVRCASLSSEVVVPRVRAKTGSCCATHSLNSWFLGNRMIALQDRFHTVPHDSRHDSRLDTRWSPRTDVKHLLCLCLPI